MNSTERKLVSQDNISETNKNSLKTYLGINSTYMEFSSKLKIKLMHFQK